MKSKDRLEVKSPSWVISNISPGDTFHPEPARVVVVRHIFALPASGYGARTIANILNLNGQKPW
jgi:hypothetical protein